MGAILQYRSYSARSFSSTANRTRKPHGKRQSQVTDRSSRHRMHKQHTHAAHASKLRGSIRSGNGGPDSLEEPAPVALGTAGSDGELALTPSWRGGGDIVPPLLMIAAPAAAHRQAAD